jgi:hypothetical protein
LLLVSPLPAPAAWLEAASVAASLEDARLAAVTALKALLTAAHKQRLAAGGSGTGRSGTGSSSSGATAAAVQSALGVLADSLGDVATHAKASGDGVIAAAAEAAAVDPLGAHLSNAAEAAYILLLLAQQWSAAAAPEEAAATSLCSGVLQAAG